MGTEMADISKCHGKDCPVKATCYRFTAATSKGYQAFLRPSKIGSITPQGCVHFWPVKGVRS